MIQHSLKMKILTRSEDFCLLKFYGMDNTGFDFADIAHVKQGSVWSAQTFAKVTILPEMSTSTILVYFSIYISPIIYVPLYPGAMYE